MQEIEPFYNWEKYYMANEDPFSPLFGTEYTLTAYTNSIYGYYIHPLWDYIGSETLWIKILFVDYQLNFAVIELFGEWNDALHNDIMHLKRNMLDIMISQGISKYILIGENVFNFHGSDDCYYEEWFEDIEDGWIAALNFRYFVCDEWRKYGIDSYVNYGGNLDIEAWRTVSPITLFQMVNSLVMKRLN